MNKSSAPAQLALGYDASKCCCLALVSFGQPQYAFSQDTNLVRLKADFIQITSRSGFKAALTQHIQLPANIGFDMQ
jgi:hypothetical protein